MPSTTRASALTEHQTRLHYNAERALSNGRKIFGFTVDAEKRYVPDPVTTPLVVQIFSDYTSAMSMQKIADWLNNQGIRSITGACFTTKSLNKLLKNRAYIGEYSHSGYVVPGGMPQLVEDHVLEEVQNRFAFNKRRGAKTKAELETMADDAPDYWLTGHMFCHFCGGSMQGVSGTSKTGRTYRYYYCINQRKKKCKAKKIRKESIETQIAQIVEDFLEDSEMLASLAVDMADHYRKTHGQQKEVLKALEARRKEVETKLANFVKAIAAGIFNDTTATAMSSLEEQKKGLDTAIQTENVKKSLFEDEVSIEAFYQRFAHATMDTVETRNLLFEYFVDKIFIDEDTVTVASYFFNSGEELDFETFKEAIETGEVLSLAREFDTSPRSGAAGN